MTLRRLKTIPLFIRAASALALGGGCAACSSTAFEDHLPTAIGGLPANAPARPPVAPDFLPVHDMPQNRELKPLASDERKKLEAELNSVRTRQERLNPKADPTGKSSGSKPPRAQPRPSAPAQAQSQAK